MKKNIPYLIVPAIPLIFVLLSCNKHNSTPPEIHNGPIIQKWNIIRHIDTTILFNALPYYLDYKGTSDDYLDFRTDGKLYRQENGSRDTGSYTINNSSIVVNNRYAPYVTTYTVEVSTSDSLQLNGISYVIVNSHDHRITHYYLSR